MEARCPHLARTQNHSHTFIKMYASEYSGNQPARRGEDTSLPWLRARICLATIQPGEVRTPRFHGFALNPSRSDITRRHRRHNPLPTRAT